MEGVSKEVIKRVLGHFEKISPDYAKGVENALKSKYKSCCDK